MEYTQNYTIDGKCPQNCDKCCTNLLPLSDVEIARIKKYIKSNKITLNNPNTVLTGYVNTCPFLQDNKCLIYSVRPEVCSWYTCNPEERKNTHFNHSNKKIVNLLTTFDPKAYCPPIDITAINSQYQESKRNAGFKK